MKIKFKFKCMMKKNNNAKNLKLSFMITKLNFKV